MKAKYYSFFLMFLALAITGCKQNEVDSEKPEVYFDLVESYPINCDTLRFGQTMKLKIHLTDNVELGSFSLDIHNNFDHHSHSTEVVACDLDPIKEAVNPITFIQDYTIPEGQKDYIAEIDLLLPASNNQGLHDEGDYHFFISLTDHEGWSVQKGLSVKVLR